MPYCEPLNSVCVRFFFPQKTLQYLPLRAPHLPTKITRLVSWHYGYSSRQWHFIFHFDIFWQ